MSKAFSFEPPPGGATLDGVQAQTPGIVHKWRCNDASGSTSLADSIGTAPLTLGVNAKLGVPGMLTDGATALAMLPTSNNDSTCGATGSVLPTSGPFCIEFLYRFIGAPGSPLTVLPMSAGLASDANRLQFAINENSSPPWYALQSPSGPQGLIYGDCAAPLLYHCEIDGLGGGYLCVDGVPVFSSTSGWPSALTSQNLTFGYYLGYGIAFSGLGVVQNIAVYSQRLTQAQKNAHVAAALRR